MEQKLSSTFAITVDGEEREIFMSFALLNRIMFLVGDPDNIGLLQVNPSLREAALEELLAVRSKTGKVTQEAHIEDLEVDLDEIQDLLDWAAEHALNFTMKALEKSAALQSRHQGKISALTASLIGRLEEPSKSPAA